MSAAIELAFFRGTLELRGVDPQQESLPRALLWDARTKVLRAPAMAYASIVLWLREQKLTFVDSARAYTEETFVDARAREARPYQHEALRAFVDAKRMGVIVLPTGAGKTHVASMIMAKLARSTLVVAPTLDLVRQWTQVLSEAFGAEVGVVGGGEHNVRPITVTTYDSAHVHMENFGNRFGLVIFDECHHLPSGAYRLAAEHCLAPFRLGLTATPERADGLEESLDSLIGRICYRREITELAGDFLAEYQTIRVQVELSSEERIEYETERNIFRTFMARVRAQLGARGFQGFVMLASRTDEGRRALLAYRRQRELAFSAPAKFQKTGELLELHHQDRTIIFTEDNAACHAVSRQFLVPAITHHTRGKERAEILRLLAEGTYRSVVTSKVLNEGVDVPEANVAIVISGSGSVREHVQRLGRILRPRDGKFALLYELVTSDTSETWTSARRREHDAYR